MTNDLIEKAREFFARNEYMEFYTDMALYGQRNAIADIESIMADFARQHTADLEEKLRVAREALERYGDEANWDCGDETCKGECGIRDSWKPSTCGDEPAREALKTITEEQGK